MGKVLEVAIILGFFCTLLGRDGAARLGLFDPIVSIVVALCLLLLLLYKRVNLGIVLAATAVFLGLLALDWTEIPIVIYQTSEDPLTISVTLATFAIMLLSQLYKETGVINSLSESVSRLVNNPKIVLSVLPAIIGFLPVSGGALMSAPLVDMEGDKLKLNSERKAYLNLWFRHTIFPVYPISQPLIVTAALTGVIVPLIIVRQIPVVIVMILVGYLIGYRKVKSGKNYGDVSNGEKKKGDVKAFLFSFSPILVTIVVAIVLESIGLGFAQQGFDVLIATFVGLTILIAISGMHSKVFLRPFKSPGIYGVALAAYAAFLLRNMMVASGLTSAFANIASNGNVNLILLLTAMPAALGLLTASPQGGVAVSVSILAAITPFSPAVAALIYISAYLGYTVAPTHLCFKFTADYFKCPLTRVYRYILPSFIVTFATAILVYLLVPL